MLIRRRTLLPPALAAGAVVFGLRPSMARAVETPPAKRVRLYFITPTNEERIHGPVVVRFGLRGMGIAPAGVAAANAGHHHLLVDVNEPLDPKQPIPASRHYIHFGAGQSETELDLEPGPHTLQLVLGDQNHMMFDPPVVSDRIRVTVLKGRAARA